jgi:hypothetical protein
MDNERAGIGTGQVLSALAWRLTRLGYAEYVKSFNPLSIGSSRWLTADVSIPDHLTAIVRLFLLGEPLDRAALEDVIGDFLDDLIAVGVIDEEAGVVCTPGIVLLPIARHWVFVSRPGPNPLLYVGDDSMGLFWRQSIRPHGSCLDLCTGPGLQALAASSAAAHVDAVEVNPVAMAIAQLNVAMNGLDDRIDVHLGNLYEPVSGAVYDNILANPPFLPVPATVNYPFVGHGSADGLRVVRDILAGLTNALAPDGVAQIICAVPGEGARPTTAVLEEWTAWCVASNFDLIVTIVCSLSMAPGSSFFEGLARTAADASGDNLDSIRAELVRMMHQAGTSQTLACFLMATRGTGRLRVQDVRHPHGSLWFV